MKKKNKNAVALGKLGGKAGKGTQARIKANRRAAKIRWSRFRREKLAFVSGEK